MWNLWKWEGFLKNGKNWREDIDVLVKRELFFFFFLTTCIISHRFCCLLLFCVHIWAQSSSFSGNLPFFSLMLKLEVVPSLLRLSHNQIGAICTLASTFYQTYMLWWIGQIYFMGHQSSIQQENEKVSSCFTFFHCLCQQDMMWGHYSF